LKATKLLIKSVSTQIKSLDAENTQLKVDVPLEQLMKGLSFRSRNKLARSEHNLKPTMLALPPIENKSMARDQTTSELQHIPNIKKYSVRMLKRFNVG
jgi:hypothetical protein